MSRPLSIAWPTISGRISASTVGTPTIGADGLLVDARTGRVADARPQGRSRSGRTVRTPQRFVDQRLLEGLREGDGRPRLDRDDLADRVRRRRAPRHRPLDRRRGTHRRRRPRRCDVVRRPPDGPDAHQLRHGGSTGRVPSRACSPARPPGASGCPNPTPAPTSPRSRRPQSATATISSSTARRSGRRSANRPTTAT